MELDQPVALEIAVFPGEDAGVVVDVAEVLEDGYAGVVEIISLTLQVEDSEATVALVVTATAAETGEVVVDGEPKVEDVLDVAEAMEPDDLTAVDDDPLTAGSTC